jgi:peptide/nickel transport system permease protein
MSTNLDAESMPGEVTAAPAGHRSPKLAELMADQAPEEGGVSLGVAAFRRMRRSPAAIIGAVIIALFVLVAVFAPLIAPYAPAGSQWISQITPSAVPGPSAGHPLGLDPSGSDLLTQLIFGARQSLIIGVVSTGIGLVVGMALGTLAGAIVDIMLSIPALMLAVSVAAVLGQRPISIMIAISAVQIPIFARLLRGSMLSQRRQDYVLASFSLGLRNRTVVMSHVLPNSVGPVIVQATLSLATAIIEVAALSYLGLGDPNPAIAEWGRMLVKAQDRLQTDPHLTLLPGACIAITALGFTLFGEALREALDPKSRR